MDIIFLFSSLAKLTYLSILTFCFFSNFSACWVNSSNLRSTIPGFSLAIITTCPLPRFSSQSLWLSLPMLKLISRPEMAFVSLLAPATARLAPDFSSCLPRVNRRECMPPLIVPRKSPAASFLAAFVFPPVCGSSFLLELSLLSPLTVPDRFASSFVPLPKTLLA
ncbi:hypothetical protein D3C73_1048220 [compost metagenome]